MESVNEEEGEEKRKDFREKPFCPSFQQPLTIKK